MYKIFHAEEKDKNEILDLYRTQIGREFCAWDEHYPCEHEIDFDLSRDALFIMKDDDGRIVAAISLDDDKLVNDLTVWNKDLQPSCEFARVAVLPELQGRGIARKMVKYALDEMKNRGYISVHFLVNKYNIKAIKSYAAFDFNVVGECFLYDQDFLCYEMELK